jgi:hypothetical protein
METKLGYYPSAELVFGIVSPIGVDYRPVVSSLENFLNHFGYTPKTIRISEHLDGIANTLGITSEYTSDGSPIELMRRKIDLGDKICKKTQEDTLAHVAIGLIATIRREPGKPYQESQMKPKTAHIIATLKRPEERAYHCYTQAARRSGFAPKSLWIWLLSYWDRCKR